MGVHDVDDFQRQVIERSKKIPVLVDFWAEWCGPCKMLGPVLEKLASDAGGRWELAKVDTETHREVAAGYGIRSIPNVKLFVDGKVAGEFVGALPEETVRQWLDEMLPGPEAGRLRQAEERLAAGGVNDIEQARLLLQGVLGADAGNEKARMLLAESLVFEDPAAAEKLLEPVGALSKAGERASALRIVARLLALPRNGDGIGDSPAKEAYLEAIDSLSRQDFDGALASFVDAAGRDRALDDDGARSACLAIFTLLGDDAPATREYRKQLARALFV